MMSTQRMHRLDKSDEVTRDEAGALMDQLVEGVLAIGARLAPVDGTGLAVDRAAIARDVFAKVVCAQAASWIGAMYCQVS
jgi:hypothetical protein